MTTSHTGFAEAVHPKLDPIPKAPSIRTRSFALAKLALNKEIEDQLTIRARDIYVSEPTSSMWRRWKALYPLVGVGCYSYKSQTSDRLDRSRQPWVHNFLAAYSLSKLASLSEQDIPGLKTILLASELVSY